MTQGVSSHARSQPGKPALICDDRVVTYAQLDGRANRLAHALRARGVGAGDRVAVMLPNSIELFEANVAISKLDAFVVPVNWHLKAAELDWILADSGAVVLVSHADLSAAWANAPCPVLVVGEDGDGSYEAAIAAGEGEHLEAASSASPVFYTSGTSGRPKGVVHGTLDRERMELGQQGQAGLWFWAADDVYLLSGPAYHAGPGGWASTALFVGATVVILPAWDAREWLRLVERHRVTRSFMVPAHFIRILEVPADERSRADLSSLRLICHAAAPCPIDVKRRIIEALAPCAIWELYGGSEGGATRISPEEWLAHPGSVGLPWPGVEVRILDPEDGRRLGPGETGLIYVRPFGGARFHYHHDPEKTEQAWRDDAFTVGDVGHLDEEGYLYITDRASDMVIRGGVNVYPREVEEVLHAHPAVVDCAVFGIPDERLGEQLKAVVEARGVTADELAAHVRAHLADFKCPAVWELVDTLPRDPNGKVLKRLLREAHWQGRDSAVV
jgi:long-chain acyl-CoA synthetase